MSLSRIPESLLLHRKKLLGRQSTLLKLVGFLFSTLLHD
jgi:hypothetical protein